MADEEDGVPLLNDKMNVDIAVSVDGKTSSDESDGEELYEVEQIVGMKKNSEGVKLYKVRWKGYAKAFDTWEPVENLESCLDMVEEYEELKEKEKKKRSEERKKRMALMAGRHMPSDEAFIDSGFQPVLTQESEPELPSPPSCSTSSQAMCMLKDTFWKDLEEGKINLFNTDMYSKVKGQGRASRPRSFKKLFSGRETGEAAAAWKTGKGVDSDIQTGKKLTQDRVRGNTIGKQHKEGHTEKIGTAVSRKPLSGKKRSRRKKLKDDSDASYSNQSEMNEGSSDSSDIIMAQVISVSTPSPPVLSCVEDYSDDSSRDLSDNRYSSPADITGSQSPNCSQGALSEDTGIGLEVAETSSPLRDAQTQAIVIPVSAPTASVKELHEKCVIASKSDITEKEKNTPGDESTKSKTVKKSVESKIAQKTKPADDPREVHRIAEKKVKLDTEVAKQKPRHKPTSIHKDSLVKDSSLGKAVSGQALIKPGKENLGDKTVSNIVTGLTSVFTPVTKQRSPAGYPVPKSDTGSSQVNAVCARRRDPPASGDFAQPLEKILSSSSLLPILPDSKATAEKGVDLAFDIDLEDIDLDELEKQLTLSPSAQPLEVTDDELKHAVLDGDYDLVKRAFAARKVYDVEQGDDMGTTLLMHAVLRNYDDIAEVLVCNGAKINAQQKNGNTALMIAAEQAHICTAALLIEMGAKVNIQQSSGETALMKAVKRGHKQIIRYLLESGANFSYLTYSGYSALSYAKLLRFPEVEDIIVDHVSRLTAEFDKQVGITLNNTAQIVSALFPLQCFPLAESDKFVITFKNELEPVTPGVGFLLFIAHARVTSQEMKCRFYGPCAVRSVFLNGVKQPSLTEGNGSPPKRKKYSDVNSKTDSLHQNLGAGTTSVMEANFVLSCHPVLPGKNELCINTESAVSSKAKLVVCAYKAQLIQ